MAAVGSYIRSLQERTAETDEVNSQAAIGQVLKAVGRATPSGERSVTLINLISLTGLSEKTVRMAVAYLRDRNLLEGTDDALMLTDLGYKAQFVVAS